MAWHHLVRLVDLWFTWSTSNQNWLIWWVPKKHAYNSKKLQNDKYLVGGWTNPFQKNMRPSNWIISPGIGVTNKTYLSCHHLDLFRPFIRGYSSKRLEKNDQAIYWNICVLKKCSFCLSPWTPISLYPCKKRRFGNPTWNAKKSPNFFIASTFHKLLLLVSPLKKGIYLTACAPKPPQTEKIGSWIPWEFPPRLFALRFRHGIWNKCETAGGSSSRLSSLRAACLGSKDKRNA